jgi:LmbE family N-acetylglucosaminyl deacetylase
VSVAFSRPSADVFVPDGSSAENALARTTHLCVAAHQDDIEIMAAHGILSCFGKSDAFFSGAVVTDGAGSSRSGIYAQCDDEAMAAIRRREQRKAAVVGEYSAQVQLGFASAHVKARDGAERAALLRDLVQLFELTRPRVVYTHNVADKHDTHVAVTLRVVEALRALPHAARPERVIGCEVWRDLDWLPDGDKVVMPLDERENLQAALLGVFDSQISGGKRYDLATLGRRRAHATYSESHSGDRHTALVYGVDLTPLLEASEPRALVLELIRRFESEVTDRLERLR